MFDIIFVINFLKNVFTYQLIGIIRNLNFGHSLLKYIKYKCSYLIKKYVDHEGI
jgi:hypothetical protein